MCRAFSPFEPLHNEEVRRRPGRHAGPDLIHRLARRDRGDLHPRPAWMRLFFPLFAALNIGMIASTPIKSKHLLVDVLAGAALAVGSSCSSPHETQRRNLHGPRRPRSTTSLL